MVRLERSARQAVSLAVGQRAEIKKLTAELADLKSTLGHLREIADTHCGFDRGTDSFGDVTALGKELDRLKSELQKRDGISGTPRVGKI
jgi:uncharacterized small protein (DUF1192 family)